jgi:cobalt/nickel transport protein
MKRKDIIIGLIVALFLAGLISIFASSSPDGLEKVAENLGFLEKGEGTPVVKSPVPNYAMPGVKNEKIATSVGGILGTLFVFGFGYGLAFIIKRRKNA